MANLISPNVSVSIIDESFYVSGRPTTLPLFFIATEDEKTQLDGVTPALGTYESGVLRVVTSIKQALELYGIPKYHYSVDGTPHHGDVRNEYGLDALLKFLEIGNRAYVVRANVNLNDSYLDIKSMWTRKVAEAADTLNVMVEEYIAAYNEANNLIPANPNYKETVTKSELKLLVNEVMDDVFKSYSFSSDLFAVNFLRDHTVDHAGYQDVMFDTSGGFLQLSDSTGYLEDELYSAVIRVVSTGGPVTVPVSLTGAQAVTFGDLLDVLNAALGANAVAEMVAGRLRITSALSGATSEVEIITDGGTGENALFASLNLYKALALPINGTGPAPLVVYDDAFDANVGSFGGVEAIIDTFNTGATVLTEFNANEAQSLLVAAAGDYDNTAEFRAESSLGANDATRRAEVVAALSAEVNNPANGVRSESLEYNVVVAPGFPELSDEMLRLSNDMLDEVFVIGETPFDKPPVGPNGVNNWGRTPAKSNSNAITYAYPHGISTNVDGRKVLTSAAATVLRVFAYNDSEQDLWWAPAGSARGLCEHLETIGYVSGALGGPTTFVEDLMDLGTRDELYASPVNINPIAFVRGRGILLMGQKTATDIASALNRTNVSRLVMFIKRELRKATFDYLFEPNDKITWDEAKFTVDGFLSGLMSRRGLYDFATVCDGSNNTDDRIDRNELWIDVAIKPVKAVEFIYIPIRVVNTGANIQSGRRVG